MELPNRADMKRGSEREKHFRISELYGLGCVDVEPVQATARAMNLLLHGIGKTSTA